MVKPLKQKIRRLYLAVIVALCFLQLFINSGYALQKEVSDPLVVGLDRNFAPHEWWSNGTAKGFNTDIIRAVARTMNKEIMWVPLDWQDAEEILLNGTVDLLFMAVTQERRLHYEFSQPILNLTLRIFVRDEVSGIKSVKDLTGHTVAIEKNDIAQSMLQQLNPDATIVPVDTQNDAIKLVSEGEVTAAFCNQYAGAFAILNNSITNVKMIGDPVDIGKRAIAVRKGNTELLTQINSALSIIKSNGEYEEILKSWFGEYIATNEYQNLSVALNIVFDALLLSLIGIAVIAAWNLSLRTRVEKATRQIKLLGNILKHDLRNIGQGLYSSLETLEISSNLSLSDHKLLHIALTEVERTIELVSDYSAIEELTSGKTKLVTVNISSMIKSIERRMRESHPTVALNISFNHSESISCIANEFIEEALYRILCFLAYPTSEIQESVVIELKAELDLNEVAISISGQDAKIPNEIQQQLTEEGLAFHTSRVGLSMSFVHSVIIASAGRIEIKSDPDNGVTTLYVYLKRSL